MSVELTGEAIALGIVTRNPEEMLGFYRDLLGFRFEAETPLPGGGSMQRLYCGDSQIKLVTPAKLADVDPAPGGLAGATGYRYWTIYVSNLDDIAERCAAAGRNVPVTPREVRPGVRIAMVEDPDGNWVEFLEQT